MNAADKLVIEAFRERFGRSKLPAEKSLNTYGCCEECDRSSERFLKADPSDPIDVAWSYDPGLGFKAFEYCLPSIAFAALQNKSENFSLLAENIFESNYEEFTNDQLDAV